MSVGYRTLLDMSDVAASGSLAPPFIDAPANADTIEAIGALSPSRAVDFVTCPLLYRFRVIDQLPEPPSRAATRGTLVHAVLERLFDQPAPDRTVQAARALLAPEWERRLEPARRELYVETVLDSGLLLRGYIDRLDIAPNGDVRVVDYKTGTAPRAEFEARALFQMKFYALVLWRRDGQVPRLLQLMYLGNGEILRYAPDESDLRATQRKTEAIWRAIERARSMRDWRPRPSRICDWCAHKALCPAFGGTPPPLPTEGGPSSSRTAAGDAESAARAEPLPEIPSPRSFAVDI